MKTLFISIICFAALPTLAQKQAKLPAKEKWQYTAVYQGGLLGGSSELNYTVQTVQGISKGAWLLGIGAGIDNYVLPGFPVVAHGQYFYGKKRSKPFAYAQAGPHFPWAKNQWNDKFGEVNQYNLKTGWLAEGGLGYSRPLGKRMSIFGSLGYSIKQATYDEVQIPWGWFLSSRWPPAGNTGELNYYHQKLTMNRLVLKTGIRF